MSREPSNQEPDIDPQGLWQSQKKEYDAMSLAAIHAKARKFKSRIQRRNAIEYMACGVVMVGFLPALFIRQSWMMQAGASWIIIATPFVAWQLHRRTSVEASPEPGESLVDGYRRQLVRQRDALRSVGLWYISPLLPGLALMMAGRWAQMHSTKLPIERDHAVILVSVAIMVAMLIGIWLLNLRGAKRLQKRIDEL